MANAQQIPDVNFSQRDIDLLAARNPQCRKRKKALVVAVEVEVGVRRRLEPSAHQQEKHESGQRIKVAGTVSAEHFVPTLHRERDNSQRDRHVHVGGARLECGPRRLKIGLRAEKDQRNRKRPRDVAHQGGQTRFRLQAHVFREGKKHGVAKDKPGYTQFEGGPTVPQGRRGLLGRGQREVGRVAHEFKAFRELRQAGFERIKPKLGFFLAEFDPNVDESGLYRRPGFDRLNTRCAVHRGQVQLHHRHFFGLVLVQMGVQSRVVQRGVGGGFHNGVKFRALPPMK